MSHVLRQEALEQVEPADVLREELPVSEENQEKQETPVAVEIDATVVVETLAEAPVAEEAAAPADDVAAEEADAGETEDMIAAVEVVADVLEVAETDQSVTLDGAAEEAGVELEALVVEMIADASDAEAVIEAVETVVEAGIADGESAEVGVNIEHLRMTEALLFAASEPLSEDALKTSLPEGADVRGIIVELQAIYEARGVNLMRVAEKWQFRTAPDLAFLLRKEKPEQKRLSRAAIETLAIIAYHQPVTRAEIEDIRGVMLSKGTLDTLMEVGWIKIRGRKRTPGRPVTYGTTEAFLVQFGLENIGHLPGMDELKAAGFLEAIPPSGLDIPSPSDQLAPDEDPYDGEDVNDLATGGADPFIPGSSVE